MKGFVTIDCGQTEYYKLRCECTESCNHTLITRATARVTNVKFGKLSRVYKTEFYHDPICTSGNGVYIEPGVSNNAGSLKCFISNWRQRQRFYFTLPPV